jgi:hypothetical protein
MVRRFIGDILRRIGQRMPSSRSSRPPLPSARNAERHRINMLAAAATALGVEEPLREKLIHLALIPIPVAADCVIVDLVAGDALERACMVMADPSRTGLLREVQRRNPPGRGDPVMDVVRSGQTTLVRRVTEDLLHRMADEEVQIELLRRQGPRSTIAVPLRAAGATFGVFTFAYSLSDRAYGTADIPFFETFVSALALPLFALRALEERSRPRTSSIERRVPEKKTTRRPRQR